MLLAVTVDRYLGPTWPAFLGGNARLVKVFSPQNGKSPDKLTHLRVQNT